MTVASLLLQPQTLRRATHPDPLPGLVEDVLGLTARVAEDPAGYAPVMETLLAAAAANGAQLAAQLQANAMKALGRVESGLSGLLGGLPAQFTALGAAGDATAAAEAQLALLDALARAVAGLTAPQLSRHLGVLLDAVQQDLGLTPAYIEGLIWGTIDSMLAAMETPLPAEDVAGLEKRLLVASILRRMRRLLRGKLSFPDYKADALAQLMLEGLQESGASAILQRIACVGKDLAIGAEAGKGLVQLVEAGSGGFTPAVPALVRRSLAAPLGAGSPPGAPVHGPAVLPNTGGSANQATGGTGVATSGAAGASPATGASNAAEAPGPKMDAEYAWYASWLLDDKELALFGFADFKQPGQIATLLKGDSKPIFTYLRGQLPQAAAQALQSYSSGDPPRSLVLALLLAFNGWLQGPSLYDEARFRDVKLTEDTFDQKAKDLKGEDAATFNRMLLEDALGNALKQLPRGFFGKRFNDIIGAIRTLILWPQRPVWIDGARQHVMWDDRPLFEGTNVTWNGAPIFDKAAASPPRTHFAFTHIPPEWAEGIARWSAVGEEAGELAWHLTKIQPRHWLSPTWFAAYDLGAGLTRGLAKRPLGNLDFALAPALQTVVGVPLAVTALSAIQGLHTEADFASRFSYWFSKFTGDLANYYTPRTNVEGYRDMLLAIVTLVNFREMKDWSKSLPAQPDGNYKQINPVVSFMADQFLKLLATLPRREDYGWKGFGTASLLLSWFLGVPIACLVGTVAGALPCALLSGGWDIEVWGKAFVKVLLKGLLKFPYFTLKSVREGDSDDGKYNPCGEAFVGYPARTPVQSPYLLPYTAGDTQLVDEGNQGFSSHNLLASDQVVEVYAYSFYLDKGELALASRPGTVDDFGSDWIRIRHDVDDSGKPLDGDVPHAVHDREAGNGLVLTYAEYKRGQAGGVVAAFALRNVATIEKGKTTVKRGFPILLAGDDSLTMEVRPGANAKAEAKLGDPGWTPKDYTMPFVFQDVDHDDFDRGVPRGGYWYTSKNEKRLS